MSFPFVFGLLFLQRKRGVARRAAGSEARALIDRNIHALLPSLEPSADDHAVRSELLDRLQALVQERWPG